MKFKLALISILCTSFLYNCSSQKPLTSSQSSVVITLKDGTVKEGLIIKKEDDKLLYMDSKTHGKESVNLTDIQRLKRANVIYDFEANPIPNSDISDAKGLSNTSLYGGGGLVLGTAVGFGVGLLIFEATSERSTLPVSMGVIGLTGGIYFGMVGSDQDYEDAVFDVRQKRYAISKQKRDKEIEEAKRELEESKKKKEELQKKIEEKNKE